MHTRFVILQEHPVAGPVTAETLAGWVDSAASSYLDLLERPDLLLEKRAGPLPPVDRLGEPDVVAVSASAAEVYPDSFTISVRVRTDDAVLNTKCVVKTPVDRELRDKLIELEHAARHFN